MKKEKLTKIRVENKKTDQCNKDACQHHPWPNLNHLANKKL